MSVISLGSINMDLVVRTSRFAKPGETLVGTDFYTAAGGKGANQAVAAGKLGVFTSMFGRVGNDLFGQGLLKSMEENGVNVRGVEIDKSQPTGTALITVDDAAENTIIIVSGANGTVDDSDIHRMEKSLPDAKVLMVQLEIPLDTIIAGAKTTKENGVAVLLDPAPARELPDELLRLCDFITPNETEAQILTGIKVNDYKDAKKAAEILLKRGVQAVIVKMSSQGSYYFDGESEIEFSAYQVNPVDTVAAGDAFNGGFAAALAEGEPLEKMMQWANACGALSTTKLGAQPSMPSREELLNFLKENPR